MSTRNFECASKLRSGGNENPVVCQAGHRVASQITGLSILAGRARLSGFRCHTGMLCHILKYSLLQADGSSGPAILFGVIRPFEPYMGVDHYQYRR